MVIETRSATLNAEHYNHAFASPVRLAAIARDAERFLDDAVRTDTSWVGLYHGGSATACPVPASWNWGQVMIRTPW